VHPHDGKEWPKPLHRRQSWESISGKPSRQRHVADGHGTRSTLKGQKKPVLRAVHLLEVAHGMEPEDGLIWVYSGNHEHGIMAFTEDGIDRLRHLIEEKQSGTN
jgi:hypothetical protein